MMISTVATSIDIREVAPRERDALVFARFDALQRGQALQLVNDHDPQPLRYQFEDRAFGQFEWTCLEAGPELWRVQIGKLAADADGAARPASGCCCSGGACCG